MQFTSRPPIWHPIAPEFTNVEAFRRAINRRHPGLDLRNYDDLHRYSISDYEFWVDLWEELGIISSVPPQKVIEEDRSSHRPKWFPGARLNYAENILRHRGAKVACTTINEAGKVVHYTSHQLYDLVQQMAAALRVNGLQAGDRVAAVITNSIMAIVIALATASIGAIYTATAPDMGAKGILDRYRQIRPTFLFAETEVLYAGRTINLVSKVAEITQELRSVGLLSTVLLPGTQSGKEFGGVPHSVQLSSFLSTGDGRPLRFEQLPFDHPLYILYSSGTTGPPKCIVHCAGGILIQSMKDTGYCFGLGQDDTFLQYTTAGWMLWNTKVSALAWGARIVLYDGSPMYPNASSFMEVVKLQNVSSLGVSPRFLATLQSEHPGPFPPGTFEALHSIAAGGAVLSPPLHEWTQTAFGPSVRVFTAMGGTDICSTFTTSVRSLPVYSGEMAHKALGIKVEVFDDAGNNIEASGEAGELVCTRPHPSVPIALWGDPSGEKFRRTYYGKYSNAWQQGDLVVINPTTKGLMILGRSDGVLNPSGIRFGSGEIYAVLEQFQPFLEDYICVGQRRPQDQDERVLLFVKMRPGQHLSAELIREVKQAIRGALSARHIPHFILEVEEIPYTINGKKIEVAVKQIVSGIQVTPSGAVANPEAFREYSKFYEIERFQRLDSKL